jgi:putative acetyltransferase
MKASDKRQKSSFFKRLEQMRLDEVVFERLNSKDEQAVTDLIRRNLEGFEEAGSVLAATFRRLKAFFDCYNRDDSCFLVVRDGKSNKIIGGAGLGSLAGLPVSEGNAEIRDLVVDVAARGRGIGRKILEKALNSAEEIGYRRIYLETTPQMVTAQNLFVAFGFRPVEQSIGGANGRADQRFADYFLLESIQDSKNAKAQKTLPALQVPSADPRV